MDKPDRIEVKQWWLIPNGKSPIRIESIDDHDHPRFARHSNGHGETTCWYLLRDGRYLGSGEHPEPSDWMVETCARHLLECGGVIAIEMPDMLGDAKVHVASVIATDRGPWSGYANGITADRSILSLYRILRGLGKW